MRLVFFALLPAMFSALSFASSYTSFDASARFVWQQEGDLYSTECTGPHFPETEEPWDLRSAPFAGVACQTEGQSVSLFVHESRGYDCSRNWFLDYTCKKASEWGCMQECLANTSPFSECDQICSPLLANPASQKLIDAIKINNLILAQEAIKEGADLNVSDIHHRTPLMNAVYARSQTMVELLLTSGADADLLNPKTQANPMFYALNNLDTEMITLLLSGGAKKESMLNQARLSVILNRLAGIGDNQRIAYFVSLGADVNWANQYNYTPLMHAAMKGHEQTVRYLLVLGADKNIKTTNAENATAKDLAIKAGFTQLAEKLL